ncbi:hypothetical protein EJA72_10470 [Pseudomonas sp. PB120]|nr:hypothetical protein [Pseudomonas sp. PB120]
MGASLLAMDVNVYACCLNKRVVRTFFASVLAPTRSHQFGSSNPPLQLRETRLPVNFATTMPCGTSRSR